MPRRERGRLVTVLEELIDGVAALERACFVFIGFSQSLSATAGAPHKLGEFGRLGPGLQSGAEPGGAETARSRPSNLPTYNP